MNIIDMRPFTVDGRAFVAYVVPDGDASIDDADCYTPTDIEKFHSGDWRFVGLVVRDDSGNTESLWSVHFGAGDGWSVDMEYLMIDDYFVPCMAQQLLKGEAK